MERGPIWFGAATRPLFGWLWIPNGGIARGGVVLCPPLGDEDRIAHRAFHKLADELVSEGFVVLRFDYDGAGDSAGSLEDPDRISAWTRSIDEAIALVRSTGAGKIAVVGMRLGATLATHAMASGENLVDAAVLWDPCTTGREFVRQQQVLLQTAQLGYLATPDDGVETPGFLFPPNLVDELRQFEVASLVKSLGPGPRILVLTREDRAVAPRLAERLVGARVEWGAAHDQAQLLDVPPLDAAVPWRTLDRVVGWLAGVMPVDLVKVAVPRSPLSVAVGEDNSGRPINERVVSLTPIGLFGIVTEPAEPGDAPWMIFLNVATEHHIGPGRLWVELSRELARYGFRSLRFDLSGNGDSPVHPGQEEAILYAREWLDDVPAVASSISPEDPSNVCLIGLCSGGYGALESGLAIRARGILALNPALSSFSMNKASAVADPRRRAFRPLPVPLVRLARKHGRIAWWIWRIWRQLAVWQAPMAVVSTVVNGGPDVYMIWAGRDIQPLREVLYWRLFGEPRLYRTGRFKLSVVDEMDHALLVHKGREIASRLLTEYVLDRYAPRKVLGHTDPELAASLVGPPQHSELRHGEGRRVPGSR